MKKRMLIILTGLLLCMVMFAGCADDAPTEVAEREPLETFSWRMATCWTPAYKLIEHDYYWLEVMDKLVGDQVNIDFYTEGELLRANEVLDAAADNTIQIGSDFPGYWAGKDTAFNLIASFPMWFTAYDYLNWLREAGGQAEVDRVYGAQGVQPFVHGPITVESGPRGTRPIRSLADYRGLKIRISGRAQGRIIAELGGSQVSILSAEVYQGMQRGLLDAAESCTPHLDWGLGYGEITTYHGAPGWHQPGSLCVLFFNQSVWDGLPQNIQDAVEIAADATFLQTLAYQDYGSARGTELFNEAGVTSHRLPMSALETLQDLAYVQLYEMAEENPSFAQIATSMAEYLVYYDKWRQLAYPFGHGWVDSKLPDVDRLRAAAR